MKAYCVGLFVILVAMCDITAQDDGELDDTALQAKAGVTEKGERTLWCGVKIEQSEPAPPPAAFGFFTIGNYPTGAWELNGASGLALYSRKTGYLRKVDLSYVSKYKLGGRKGWVYKENDKSRRWFFSACPYQTERPYYAECFVNDIADECGWEYRGTVRGIPIPLE
jgi:hypothetical protein